MGVKLLEPDFRWIEVVATAAFAAVLTTLAGLAIRNGIEADDILGLLGAILGAGIGAWLAATAGRTAIRSRRLGEDQDRQTFVQTVLETVSEEMQAGSTASTGHSQFTISRHFGETQIQLLNERARRALILVEDANEKIGADYRALLAFHTAIRTLWQVQEHCSQMLERERTATFGREAIDFVNTTRNSIRISIELALRTLVQPTSRQRPFRGMFDADPAGGSA